MNFQRYSENITCWWSRISFPHIWKAEPIMIQGQPISEPRFSCIVILHDEIVQRIREIEARLIAQSWPHWGAMGEPPPGTILKRALQQGDIVRPGDPHMAGKWVLSANAKQESPPKVVTKDPASGSYFPVTDQSLVYGGCEAHANVGLYTTQIKLAEPQINVGLNILELTGRQLPSFENRVTAEQALGSGPDVAAPPPPPGGPDVGAPVQHARDAADPLSW